MNLRQSFLYGCFVIAEQYWVLGCEQQRGVRRDFGPGERGCDPPWCVAKMQPLDYLCGPATTQTVSESGVIVLITYYFNNIYQINQKISTTYYFPRQQTPSQNLC